MADLKQVACEAIDKVASELHELSDKLWSHPELAFEEKYAHKILTEFLEKQGFQVEKSYKLETAFRATYGSTTKPNVCVISEYDALPEIGHACGHNLIAEVGVAAGIGIMAAINATKKSLGKITVLGTPAEEAYGGKIDLIDAGAFSDVDIAMMSHPAPENDSKPIMIARESMEATYKGKAAHAAGYPWEGVNALDAVFTCYQSIACLRQQMKPDWRIHCIVTEGGIRTNIIPEKATLQVGIRTPTDTELSALKEKIISCFNAAAMATGCEISYHTLAKPYSSMLHNQTLVSIYEKNLEAVSIEDVPTLSSGICGSSDIGNVAHVVPSIHPEFYIGGTKEYHTRGFTDDAGHERAQKYTLMQAKALAMTALDAMIDPDLLQRIKQSFEADIKSNS